MSVTRDGWGTFLIAVEIMLVDSWYERDNDGKAINKGKPLKQDWPMHLDPSKPEGTDWTSKEWLVILNVTTQ